jgi:2'-5' RNA ligase
MGAHEREFVPHLSIARLKDAAKGKEPVAEHLASEFGPITFHVDELVIYESTLTPTGSVYNVLSRHPLRAG